MRRSVHNRRKRSAAVGDRAHRKPGVGQLLAERLDGGNIPIDDEYLLAGFCGGHVAAILEIPSFTVR
jgi:hypothetical protein